MIAGAIPFPDISPEIFTLHFAAFSLSLKWYGLSYIAGVVLAGWIAHRAIGTPSLWRDGRPAMTNIELSAFIAWIGLGIILGGRIGSILFYRPDHYLHDPLAAFALWEGGMSFHGGLIGVSVTTLIFCRRYDIPILPTADLLALGAPVGLFLGRLANFVNAELWGRPTDLPWGVIFPGEAAQACGQPLGEICARHPSQIYEAILEGALLGALLLFAAFRRKSLFCPGRLTGLFLSGYGLARFFIEFVRQPDRQFVTPSNPMGLAWHVGPYGLTMGQVLCLPMIATGIILALLSLSPPGSRRRKDLPSQQTPTARAP